MNTKDYYLYSEDVKNFVEEKDLPESDTSKYSKGNLEENFKKKEVIEFEKTKKSVKSKYFIGQHILDMDADNLENAVGDITESGNERKISTTIEEDGWYQAIYQNKGEDSGQNTWWVDSNIDSANYTLTKSFWVNSSGTKYLKFDSNLRWEAGEPKKVGDYFSPRGKKEIKEEGYYTIYNQIINLYKTEEIKNETKNEIKETFYGTICFNFINVESDDYGSIEIKSRNQFLSSEVLTNYYYQKSIPTESYDIPFNGVEKDPNSVYFYEYNKKSNKTNYFIRKYIHYNSYNDFISYNSRSVGYYEEFLHLKKEKPNFERTFKNGIIQGNLETTIPPYKGKPSKKRDYQFTELSNFEKCIINNKKSPLENTGIVLNKFRVHTYNKKQKEKFKLIFLGKNEYLTNLNYTIKPDLKKGTEIHTNILQNDNLTLPRGSILKYHFTYDDDKVQISRGQRISEKTIYVYKNEAGETIEKDFKTDAITDPVTHIQYDFYYQYTLRASLEESHVIKKNKNNQIIEIVPLNSLCNFKRISLISEEIEFQLAGNYEFIFIETDKAYRIYFDRKYIGNGLEPIEYIEVNGKKITEKQDEFYEIKKEEGNQKDREYEAKIQIKYNKPMYGLVRDLTAFSSGLIKLLDDEKASWTYDPITQIDTIIVFLKNDLYLDLSNHGPLYLLNIVVSLDKGIKNVYLQPMRLKLGRVPYCFRDISLSSSGLYFTEGEQLFLDFAFNSSDKDLRKKIKLSEKSVLPTVQKVYDPNVYIYNTSLLEEDLFEELKTQNENKNVDNFKKLYKVDNEKTVDLDLYKLAGKKESDNFYRSYIFQTCSFSTLPLNFTINLILTYQTYNLTLYPDPSGLIKPLISQTTFVPGEIIKIIFNLDNKHRLSTNIPDSKTLKETFSNISIDPTDSTGLPNSTFYINSFTKFFECLFLLQNYDDIDYKNEEGQQYKQRKKNNEKVFSFFLLNKNFKNPHKISEKDIFLGSHFKMSNIRETQEEERSNNYESFLQNKFRQFKLKEEEISLYFVSTNADIDLWLSSELYENFNLLTLGTGKTTFYKVEQSGYYVLFLSGSRCGDGGDGGEGKPAGNGACSSTSVSAAGNDGVPLGSNVDISLPHPDHWPKSKNSNVSIIKNKESVFCYGKPGGCGGDGWRGGNGGNGGQGSGVVFGFQEFPLTWGFGIWHFNLSFKLGKLPGLSLVGGKAGGPAGHGGSGYILGGSSGFPGSCSLFDGTGFGKVGNPGKIIGDGKVVNRFLKQVFLKKGTILMITTGENGKKGLEGKVAYSTHIEWEDSPHGLPLIGNILIHEAKKQLSRFDYLLEGKLCGPDGSNGTPGLPSCIYVINDKSMIIDDSSNGNPFTKRDINFIYVEGLSIGKEKLQKSYWVTKHIKGSDTIHAFGKDLKTGDYRVKIFDPNILLLGYSITLLDIFGCLLILDNPQRNVDIRDILVNKKYWDGDYDFVYYDTDLCTSTISASTKELSGLELLFSPKTEFWGGRMDYPLMKKNFPFSVKNENELFSKFGSKNPSVFNLIEFENNKLSNRSNIISGTESTISKEKIEKAAYVEIINNEQVGYDSSGASIYYLGPYESSEIQKLKSDYNSPILEENSPVLLGEYL